MKKKPIVAWAGKIPGVEGIALVGARTYAGAVGFCREAWKEANENPAAVFDAEVERLGALDAWALKEAPGVCWELQIVLYQEADARLEALRAAYRTTLASMRKDGQGLNLDQANTLACGLGLGDW